MSRALALTERQARTLLRAADKERGIVEVRIGKALVRLIPGSMVPEDHRIDEQEEIRL